MRVRTLKVCFSEGVKGIFRNGLMSIASIGTITACLIILGIMFCLVRNVEHFADGMGDTMGMVVFLEDNVSQERVDILIKEIRSRKGVKEVKYVSPEEAWKQFQEELLGEGELDSNVLEGLDENPLAKSANIEVYLNDIEQQDELVDFLEGKSQVRKINYSADATKALTTFSNLITWIGMALILFLIFVALLLITNTIKLSVYIRRNEINIMKFLGARDSFVKLPFVVEGILIGLMGAILPCVLMYFGYDYLIGLMDSKFGAIINLVSFLSVQEIMVQLLPLFLGLSIVVGTAGGMISIRKYLKV